MDWSALTAPGLPPARPAARRAQRLAAAWAGALCLGAAPAQASLWEDMPVGMGYAAWDLCTRVLASGDDLQRVRALYTEPKVAPLPWVWQVAVQPGDSVGLNTLLPLQRMHRVAVFTPGVGCTVLPPGQDRATWHPPVRATLAPPFKRSALPWPDGEGAAAPPSPGNAAAWHAAADALFGETTEAPRARQNTLAVLVAHQGQLVYERYAPGYRQTMPLLGWSMSKTLTALWAGALQGQGLLKLDAPLPMPGWAGSNKAAITWRHALNMAPGLAWNEGHAGFSDTSDMLFSHADHGAYAAAQPRVAAPGTQYVYSTGTTALVSLALRQALGGDAQRTHDSLVHTLFEPLGIADGFVESDASGTPAGGARGVLRPRDWLKLGQLILQEGRWQQRSVVPPDFIRFMRSPSPANASYGGFLRLFNGKDMPAGMPRDVVYFSGLMGQYIMVVPSQQLLVLRMGVSFDQDATRQRVFDATVALSQALAR